MPILRPHSSERPGDNTSFNASVSEVPMAMSMMIDSMVRMLQASRTQQEELDLDELNSTSIHGY